MDFFKKLIKKVFQYEAKIILKKYKPKIIAITGSVGKTLTKEAIYSVLSKKYFVRKSEKSFTAELGTPLTIVGGREGIETPFKIIKNLLYGLSLIFWKENYPEYLILEIDADKTGDLSFISNFICPDILVMTAIGEVPAHIESFKSIDDFISEKKSLIKSLRSNGFIVYNADDERVASLAHDSNSKKISCGLGRDCMVSGSEFKVLYTDKKDSSLPNGMSFDIKSKGESHSVVILESVGIQNEYAVLIAFALGQELGVSTTSIMSSLSKYKVLPGRMRILPAIKGACIIDDSYNSSPVAMAQSLSVLKSLKTKGRRVAVVGDMLELGRFSADSHKNIGVLLKDSADFVITVGLRSRRIAEELLNYGFSENNIISTDTAKEAGIELQKILLPQDVVLVKGSQSMRMERVVEEVMAHPEDKGGLLVRQDEEWLNRS